MLPYHHDLRPCLTPDGRDLGLYCPVCGRDTLGYIPEKPLDYQELPDGGTRMRCLNCRAPLRANPQGFVFWGAEDDGVPL